MKILMTVLIFLILSSQLVHSLECYQCDYGTCLVPSTKTCGFLESCVTYTSTAVGIPMKKKGCVNPLQCFAEASFTYLGATVTSTPSCCITNLCNSAVTPRLSAVTGIAVLVSLWLAKLF
ncbi:sperm acrosome membrane-associated protein 4-like [Pelobates fuscus]|uniref:sperm acrosome membrane-associated protein 4-like n=1 Tax=Pelobates fuscus TaxID=191477 RepID=UPI002FE49F38